MTWKKVSEEKPRVGQLVVVRERESEYEDYNKYYRWEYNAGILREANGNLYLEVAHGEYHVRLDEDTEWQEIEE